MVYYYLITVRLSLRSIQTRGAIYSNSLLHHHVKSDRNLEQQFVRPIDKHTKTPDPLGKKHWRLEFNTGHRLPVRCLLLTLPRAKEVVTEVCRLLHHVFLTKQ